MPIPALKNLSLVSLLTSIISLALLAAGAWVFLSTQEQVQRLEHQMQGMQENMKVVESMQPEWVQMHQRMRSIEEHIHQLEDRYTQAQKPAIPPMIHTITPQTPSQAMKQSPPKPKPKHQAEPSWMVVIASFDSLKKAKKAQHSSHMRSMGSQITRVHLKHGTWYRIVKSGFKHKDDAKKFVIQLKKQGFHDAWIQFYTPKNTTH